MMTISTYLQSISFFPPELNEAVLNILEEKEYEHDPLSKPGRICNDIWFLQAGFIWIWEKTDRKDVCHWLQEAPSIIIAPDSSLDGIKPSNMFIEPIGPCVTQKATVPDVHKIIRQHPEFLEHYKIINATYRRIQNEREADLLALGPEERFLKLLAKNPSWFQLVPNEILMKYIDVSYSKFYAYKAKYIK